MKILYNYLSLVALGSFNPAILTLDFLNNVCKLDLGDLTGQSPSEIPVHRRLDFNRLHFIVDIERFQIREEGIDEKEFRESKQLEYFDAYYQKLPYTPLKAIGMNINVNLEIEKIDAENLFNKTQTPKTYLDFFSVSEIEVEEISLHTNTEKVWKGSNYCIKKQNDLTRRINSTRNENSVILNYNAEAGNLRKDLAQYDLLINRYSQICDEFTNFIKHLEV